MTMPRVCRCAPDTLEHLLREFADEWEFAAIDSTKNPKSDRDTAIDEGFRAGVGACAAALRALLDRVCEPESIGP